MFGGALFAELVWPFRICEDFQRAKIRDHSHEVFSSLGFGFTWLISLRTMCTTFWVNSLLPRSVFGHVLFWRSKLTPFYSKRYNSSYYRVKHLVWLGGFHSINFVKYLVHKPLDKPNPAYLSPLFAIFLCPETNLPPHVVPKDVMPGSGTKEPKWELSN